MRHSYVVSARPSSTPSHISTRRPAARPAPASNKGRAGLARPRLSVHCLKPCTDNQRSDGPLTRRPFTCVLPLLADPGPSDRAPPADSAARAKCTSRVQPHLTEVGRQSVDAACPRRRSIRSIPDMCRRCRSASAPLFAMTNKRPAKHTAARRTWRDHTAGRAGRRPHPRQVRASLHEQVASGAEKSWYGGDRDAATSVARFDGSGA